MPVQFFSLGKQTKALRQEIDAAISAVIDSNHFILGKNVVELEKEIADAKRLKTLREEAIERWRMLGLLDGIDENLITITVTARKFGIDEIKK